jgi:SAM-dependent methyltransferase
MSFSSLQESHKHSLETLDLLYAYSDFMESVDSMCDIGCGKEGLDLEWWATREIDDGDVSIPLNIKCHGIDINDKLLLEHDNVTYTKHDFETPMDKQFDVLYSHDSFQYALNPLQTLSNWYHMLTENGMLVLQVPSTTNLKYNKLAFSQPNFHYYNHTLDGLIHMLAVSGFDCESGFFHQQQYGDNWVKAIVYKSDVEPMNPKTTTWYDLADKKLLPKTGVESINNYGYMKREDLVLPWLDYSNIWYGQ